MTMCEPLPQNDCDRTELEELILSAVVFLASRLVQPDNEKDKRMTGIYGLKCFASWEKSDLGGYWAKTSQGFCQLLMFQGDAGEHSEPFCMTWPRWGIVSDGHAMELPMLGRRIKGTECLSWPTPRANDAKKRGNIANDIRNGLPAAVKHWPTPTVPNGGRSPKGGCMSLTGMTPDGKKRQVDLQYAVKNWPTPTGQEAKNAALSQGNKGRDNIPGVLSDQGITGQLNADWVECLMNFPIGWTDIDCDNPAPWPGPPALLGIGITQSGQYPYEPPRVTSGQKNRAKRLKCLGNAVYPEQIYPIFAAIREIEAGA